MRLAEHFFFSVLPHGSSLAAKLSILALLFRSLDCFFIKQIVSPKAVYCEGPGTFNSHVTTRWSLPWMLPSLIVSVTRCKTAKAVVKPFIVCDPCDVHSLIIGMYVVDACRCECLQAHDRHGEGDSLSVHPRRLHHR